MACGPSDEELQAELDAFVEERNACTAAPDCDIAFISCPLGCYAAVAQDAVAEVEAKAQELVHERDSGTTECDCDAPPTATCEAGRCAEVPFG